MERTTTIELPRYLARSVGVCDAVVVYGWIWELWGCKFDEQWLEKELAPYNRHPRSKVVPLTLPNGWGIEKSTEEFTRRGNYSRVDYWVIDEQKRRRMVIEVSRESREPEYMIMIYPRFSIFSDKFSRLKDSSKTTVLIKLLEGDKKVVQERDYPQPTFPDRDFRVSDRREEEERVRLIKDATDEFKAVAASLCPGWDDPVTSWFDVGTNPFEGGYENYLRTSGLLFRWMKMLHQESDVESLYTDRYPYRSIPFFERVEVQRQRLLGTVS